MSTDNQKAPSDPKESNVFLLKKEERQKKETPPEKKSRQTAAISVGKSVSAALKDNFARTMATAFANHIIALTDQKYKLAIEKKYISVEEEEESEDEAVTKLFKRDLINDIVEGKDTFVGGGDLGKQRAASCPTKITLWLSSAEDAFKSFANFILSLKASADGKRTLRSLYQEDVRKTVEVVMQRQNLFDNASSVAKGLARFDAHINLLPSDRISVLDSSIAMETENAFTRRGDSLNTLSTFKDETKQLLCPRVTDLLKHLSPNSAATVFNDIVKYVEKSFSFYKVWGDLPGIEFRILLADINIKIMEEALLASKSAPEDVVYGSSSSTLATLNLSEEDTRTMINALQKIREWKPISKNYPSRIDKARDVVLIPETGNISRIPVTPTDLLQLVFYINALLSLERRNVFTNGFFNAACILISQCLSSNYNPSGKFIRPSKLAAKIARDNLLSLHVVKNVNDDGSLQIEKEKEKGEDHMSVDEESASSSSSFSEEEEEKEKEKKRRRTKSKSSSNKEETTALTDLIYKTGGFFYDTSEFGKKIRSLINAKDHIGLANYASSLIDSGSKIAVQRLVASLMDILILKTEQCEEMKKSCSCLYGKNNIAETSPSIQSNTIRLFLNPQADKNEMTRFFFSATKSSIVSKHEAYVLIERLLPSDNNNDIGTVTLSFFRKRKTIEEDEVGRPTCPALNNLPNLLKFSKELVGEMTKHIVSMLNKVTPESSNKQIMDVDTFLKTFSPMGSKLNIPTRIKSAVIITDDATRILFSPVEEVNTIAGLKLTSLVKAVRDSPQMENVRQNAADLRDPDNVALSVMLFPPSSYSDDEITVLSKLAKGLFSIAEGSIAVVRSKDFDDGGASSYALVLDVSTMDKAVKFAASTLENATARALYLDEDMRPSKVLEGASFVEGALSYILDRKENIHTTSDECPKPTALAKYTMTDVTSRYLKHLKQHEKRVSGDAADPAVAKEEAASERALVEEVTNRATDIVNAQMVNAMGVAIIMSAAIKILEADVEEAEARSMNNQSTSLEDYHGTRENVVKRIGIIKNLAHLCITTAAAAASNMTKLSNQHFFDLIKEANATMIKKKSVAKNEVAESEDYHDKEMKKAMLLGYTNQPEAFYIHKHGSDGPAKKGSATSFKNMTEDWLHNAIDSITEKREKKDNGTTNTRASSKFLLYNEPDFIVSSNKKRAKETEESIMDKLNEML